MFNAIVAGFTLAVAYWIAVPHTIDSVFIAANIWGGISNALLVFVAR